MCQAERNRQLKMVHYYSEDGYKKQSLNIPSKAHTIRNQFLMGVTNERLPTNKSKHG